MQELAFFNDSYFLESVILLIGEIALLGFKLFNGEGKFLSYLFSSLSAPKELRFLGARGVLSKFCILSS